MSVFKAAAAKARSLDLLVGPALGPRAATGGGGGEERRGAETEGYDSGLYSRLKICSPHQFSPQAHLL